MSKRKTIDVATAAAHGGEYVRVIRLRGKDIIGRVAAGRPLGDPPTLMIDDGKANVVTISNILDIVPQAEPRE